MPQVDTGSASTADLARRAREALEKVCSGASVDSCPLFYSPDFLDHVNEMELRGHVGVRQSIRMYRAVLPDLEIIVEEQLVDHDRVTSRFVASGTSRGRHVRFRGITVSHFRDGLIVEDWSVTDTLGLLRQLGLWRSLLAGWAQWRVLRGTDIRAR
jgi:predicted ester cyclase